MKLVILLTFLNTFSYAGTLKLKFKNLNNKNGMIRIAIWDQSTGFPKDYTTSIEQVSILATQTEYTIENLKSGSYAVAIFHDQNNDEVLNTNMLGIPKEGFGFSNNPRLLFGPPSFRKSRIKINNNDTKSQTIYMKHF